MKDLLKDGMYSVQEIKENNFSVISEREVQRYASRNGIKKIDRRYILSGYQILEMNKFYKERADKRADKKASRDVLRDTAPIEKTKKIEVEEVDQDMMEIPIEDYELLQETILNERVQGSKIEQLLERVADYKNEITYLRESLDKRNDQMDSLLRSINDSLKTIQQQNFIEAKDKGYDKE